MNYEALDTIIKARRLSGDALEPREELNSLFRGLEQLRVLYAEQPDPEIEKQIRFFEQLLE